MKMELGKEEGLQHILVLDAVNLGIMHCLARLRNNVQKV
jgi:hypothetical protein